MRPAEFTWNRCWCLTKWSACGWRAQVLCGIFVISVGVFIAHAYWDQSEPIRQVFELLKIGALPLVALVISFYFPDSATR
ncbi:hypothetical protein SOD_c26970 [Serratia plymuthica 4Rx13]|nr:hypothetical protein SOD_c26970 [Serratia plymuthica 4Rx13]